MSKAVFCITQTEQQAERILRELQNGGFSNRDISVLFPDKTGTKDFAHEKGTKAPEGAATGAASGGVLGGAVGWLLGVGALAIPGLGPFVAAGPIMAALGGAAVGAAVGGLTGTLIGLGMPEYEAKRYEGKIKAGGILVSVHADDANMRDRAKDIFERNGAEDIATAAEESVPSGSKARS